MRGTLAEYKPRKRSGYDPANYAELSPGIVLTSLIIEDAIKRGIKATQEGKPALLEFITGKETAVSRP